MDYVFVIILPQFNDAALIKACDTMVLPLKFVFKLLLGNQPLSLDLGIGSLKQS